MTDPFPFGATAGTAAGEPREGLPRRARRQEVGAESPAGLPPRTPARRRPPLPPARELLAGWAAPSPPTALPGPRPAARRRLAREQRGAARQRRGVGETALRKVAAPRRVAALLPLAAFRRVPQQELRQALPLEAPLRASPPRILRHEVPNRAPRPAPRAGDATARTSGPIRP